MQHPYLTHKMYHLRYTRREMHIKSTVTLRFSRVQNAICRPWQYFILSLQNSPLSRSQQGGRPPVVVLLQEQEIPFWLVARLLAGVASGVAGARGMRSPAGDVIGGIKAPDRRANPHIAFGSLEKETHLVSTMKVRLPLHSVSNHSPFNGKETNLGFCKGEKVSSEKQGN